MSPKEHCEIAIIGAGFAGIGLEPAYHHRAGRPVDC